MYLVLAGVIALGGLFLIGFHYRSIPSAHLLYLVPPVHALADGVIGVSSHWPLHTGELRMIALLMLVAFLLPRVRVSRVTLPIFAFLAYLVVIGLTATDLGETFQGVVRLGFALLMFPLAYYSVETIDQLKKLNASLCLAVVIILIFFAVAQLLRIGDLAYHEGVYMGGYAANSAVYITYVITYGLILLPAWMAMMGRRHVGINALLLTVYIPAVIVLLLVFRRGAMLALVFGLLAYFLLSRQRARLARVGIISAALVAATLPLYVDTLQRLLPRRGRIDVFVEQMAGGRTAEISYVVGEFLNGSLWHSLFGSELFNSRLYMDASRPLHIDFANLLLGSGLVGLLLYLVILFSMAVSLRRGRTRPQALHTAELRAAGYGLIVACVTLSFSSQIWAITPLSLFFLFMGAILSIVRRSHAAGSVARYRNWCSARSGSMLRTPLAVTSRP